MTKDDYQTFVDALLDDALALSKKKSHDYATDDVLSNFKRMSKLVSMVLRKDITPEDMAMIFLLLKIDREMNLKSQKKKPKNESRRDTWIDMINYSLLYMGICQEEEVNSK